MTTPLQTFNQYRDPVQQAKEMETFMRLQQASLENFQHLGLIDSGQPAQTPTAAPPQTPWMSPGVVVNSPGQQGPPAAASQQGFLQPSSGAIDPSSGLDSMTPAQLVDLASSLGVDNAEKIPASALRQIITARRQDPLGHFTGHEGDWSQNMRRNFAELGIGVAEGATNIAGQISNLTKSILSFATGITPDENQQGNEEAKKFLRGTGLDYAFDVADRNLSIKGAQNWLGKLEAGIQANTNDQQKQTGAMVKGLGTFLPYAGVGEGLFAGIGTVLDTPAYAPIFGRMTGSPFMRGVIKGAGAALALDAGTDKPWMGSMQDLSDMMKPGSTITDRASAGMRLALGSRMMDAALGGLMGGVFGALDQRFRPSTALARQQGWDTGSQIALDAANEIPSTYTMLQDGTILALPRGPEEGGAAAGFQGGGPDVPQPGAPQGFNPFRALGPGEQASAQTFVDGQPVQQGPQGPLALRPPLRPGAQAAVDAMQGSIQDAYRAVSLGQQRGYSPSVMDQLRSGVASDVSAYEQGIARLTMDPNAWERRGGGVPEVAQTFSDLQQPAGYLPGPMRAEIQQRINRFPETATIYKPLRASYATLDRGTATDLVYQHQQELAALEDQRRNFVDPASGLPVRNDDLEAQIQDAHNRMLDTLFRADIPPNHAPTVQDWWKQNEPSPATPSRDLVDKYGGVLRNSKGDQKLWMSGRGVSEENLSNTTVFPGLFNDAGEKVLYFTDSPVIAGGDPFGQINEDGYAPSRGGALEGQRANIQIQVNELNNAISQFEAQGPASGVTPTVYEEARKYLPTLQARLNELPVPAPNVRMVFLAVKNPWLADEPLSQEDGHAIIDAAAMHPDAAAGGFDFDQARESWDWVFNQHASNPTGNDLYKLLSNMYGSDPWKDPSSGGDPNTGEPEEFGKSRVNQTLQSMGYDAIKYDGGMRWGTPVGKHEAVAVFDPRSVIHAYLPPEALEQEAANLGIAMGKQFEVADSPLTPEILQHAEVSDADVAAAAASNHPGGTHVIRNVTDLPKLMEDLQNQNFGGSWDGLIKAYRPVMHPSGRMDVLVSSLGQITDDMAEEYARSGLFKGASILVKKSGKLGTVQEIYPDKVVWQSEAQAKRGPKFKTRSNHADVELNTSSPEVIDAPKMYNDWQNYVLGETQARVRSAGQTEYTASMDDPEVFQRIPALSQQFFAERGITDPGARGAMFRYFEQQRVADIQDLDPTLRDMNAGIEQQIDELNNASNDPPDLYAVSKQKGYDLVTDPTGGFILQDQFSPEKIRLANEDAVRTVLSYMPSDRLPDAAPASEVPVEAAPQYPDNEGHVQPNEDQLEDAMMNDVVNELAEEEEPDWEVLGDEEPSDLVGGPLVPPEGGLGGSGAGGGNGGPPNRGLPVGGEPPYDPNRRPGNTEQLTKRQRIRLQLQGQGILRLQQEWVKALGRKLISPARVFFANLENDLHNAGAVDLQPWLDFDKVTAGMDQAHNFIFPFMDRLGGELSKVPARYVRNGTFARVWLMENPVDRALYAAGSGMKRPAVEAMRNIENILNEMHGDTGQTVQDLKRFIAESRHNHETQSFGPNSYPDNYPSVGHFRDVASSHLMRFEKIDARSLFRNYVRSFGFNRYVAPAWDSMADTWNTVRNTRVEGHQPYAPLADMVLDWMNFVKHGPEPGKDMAVRVVNRTLNMLGVPLTHGETRKLMQMFQSSMYNALQGWRLHVIVRDSTQPLLAGPTVGFDNLGRAYKNAVRFGSVEREAMKQRAYDMGVTQHRMPRFEGTRTFEDERPETQASFGPVQNAIRSAGQAIGDVVRDATPAAVRTGVLRKFAPLTAYTAEGEWNRILVGEAAHSNFMNHWNAYQQQLRIAAVTGDASLAPNPNALVKAINADSFRPAIARRIEDLIRSGQIEGANGALGTYMRAVADRTQFTYGGRHAPMAIHSTAARMGYAFGNFATQYAALQKEGMAFGSLAHRFKFLATVAGVSGAFELAYRKWGWNFRNFEWWQSLLFTGSPLMAGAISVWQNANAAREVATSENPPSAAMDQLGQVNGVDVAAGMLRTYNPLQGAFYDASGVSRAMDSPNPTAGIARFLITGETQGGARDWNQMLTNHTLDPSLVPPSTVPAQAVPQVQTRRTQFAPVRLPGVNQYQGHDSTYQSMMNDMLEIDKRYGGRGPGGGPVYNPPASDTLGGGAGGR